ncbi:MAG: hypothetical protein H0X38_00480 [Planctomycetes bacterium]|nr:hypothetical protein [Planctomycetota bacterium]
MRCIALIFCVFSLATALSFGQEEKKPATPPDFTDGVFTRIANLGTEDQNIFGKEAKILDHEALLVFIKLVIAANQAGAPAGADVPKPEAMIEEARAHAELHYGFGLDRVRTALLGDKGKRLVIVAYLGHIENPEPLPGDKPPGAPKDLSAKKATGVFAVKDEAQVTRLIAIDLMIMRMNGKFMVAPDEGGGIRVLN